MSSLIIIDSFFQRPINVSAIPLKKKTYVKARLCSDEDYQKGTGNCYTKCFFLSVIERSSDELIRVVVFSL